MVVADDDLLQQLDQEGREINAADGGFALGRPQPQFPGHLVQGTDVGADEQVALAGVAVDPVESCQLTPAQSGPGSGDRHDLGITTACPADAFGDLVGLRAAGDRAGTAPGRVGAGGGSGYAQALDGLRASMRSSTAAVSTTDSSVTIPLTVEDAYRSANSLAQRLTANRRISSRLVSLKAGRMW
ncbi:hypothetical protein [Actinomadura sp. NEAU-AAG7]|uniref:hypothetical protein n=1 Tax=Actinomadura sp. NEAU-AAG7 TaxID=2839640 RepID=UPI002032FC5C|nr:hypothetical protein [Actinomadura sp. NEAU-AAG7]